jgi:hypothetical protein
MSRFVVEIGIARLPPVVFLPSASSSEVWMIGLYL